MVTTTGSLVRRDEYQSLARRAALAVTVVVASLQLAACSTASLLDSEIPVPTNYVIAPLPPATSAVSTAASHVDLAIGRPDVAPGLDTQRIAVLRGRELDYYRRVQWGGTTTELVQSFLVNSLQDQHLFRSVTAEQARVAGPYILDTEVRDFQAEYVSGRSAPRVRVTIVGRLVRVADRKLVATIPATAVHDCDDNRMSVVAAAFESAAHEVAQKLAQETAAAIVEDRERLSKNDAP
jgi:cholesterol transport system auxiliary component